MYSRITNELYANSRALAITWVNSSPYSLKRHERHFTRLIILVNWLLNYYPREGDNDMAVDDSLNR